MHSILPLTLQKVSAHRGIIESAAFSRVKNVFWGTFEILPGNVHVGTSKTASIFDFEVLFYNAVYFDAVFMSASIYIRGTFVKCSASRRCNFYSASNEKLLRHFW
jgi:hypothetical protein